MADIVIGIASSHTPQLSSGVDMWPDHAARDQRYALLGKDAAFRTYEETLATADPALARELEPDVWARKYERAQAAVESLTAALKAAGPDLALVIGDDQRELFVDDGIPAFACFTGTELVDMAPAPEAFAQLPKGIQAAYWAVHGEQEGIHHVAQELSAHVAERLALADFDLTVVNTYYPPNVPSAARCYRLGQALREAVESWEPDARVAVIASGGLTHFVIDEELDRGVLGSIAAKDAAGLAAIPRDKLRSGNSEILNWVTAAGALEGLTPTVVDYVPGYRTPAGTGTGMAFARWE